MLVLTQLLELRVYSDQSLGWDCVEVLTIPSLSAWRNDRDNPSPVMDPAHEWRGTDKDVGIANLKLAADKGRFLLPLRAALILLFAVAALRDTTARNLLASFSREFPQNSLYQRDTDTIQVWRPRYKGRRLNGRRRFLKQWQPRAPPAASDPTSPNMFIEKDLLRKSISRTRQSCVRPLI